MGMAVRMNVAGFKEALRAKLTEGRPSWWPKVEATDDQLLACAYREWDFVANVLQRNSAFVNALSDELAERRQVTGDRVRALWDELGHGE